MRDSSNYRAIALSSLLCKLFDTIIIETHEDNLITDDLQYGYKKQSSTIVCTSLLLRGPWKKCACRGPATITRLPSLFINQFFHNIKLLQPYDVFRHQPEPFYGPDCYICEH